MPRKLETKVEMMASPASANKSETAMAASKKRELERKNMDKKKHSSAHEDSPNGASESLSFPTSSSPLKKGRKAESAVTNSAPADGIKHEKQIGKDMSSSLSAEPKKKGVGKKTGMPAEAPLTEEVQKDSGNTQTWLRHVQLASKHRKFVGAHVSAAGGVENSVTACKDICGMAFAMFLKNQRRWDFTPLKQESVDLFKTRCRTHLDLEAFGGKGSPPASLKREREASETTSQGASAATRYGYILPHASYLINLANPDKAKRDKSFSCFLEDLQRCESLGIRLYNFHPGSTVGECSREVAIQNIATCINEAHKKTSSVVIVIENMSGQKNVIGSKFEDLRDIISAVKNKERVGVCLDTCHLFAAGYDIGPSEKKKKKSSGDDGSSIAAASETSSTAKHHRIDEEEKQEVRKKFDAVMNEFHKIVDIKYLRSIHLNDSKDGLESHHDRHELVGKGKLGVAPFWFIMNDSRFNDIPMVLETPDPDNGKTWREEIKLLYSLIEDKM